MSGREEDRDRLYRLVDGILEVLATNENAETQEAARAAIESKQMAELARCCVIEEEIPRK